ncbi:putative bifunctional phosphatase/peptidyl-prolyl cis-trans isomerase [Rubripirellula tenax]|uniref:peptidylprolyl isomerase n=1 Tax=Rubripirellula tenax TaxID=2528015 RepID=A0A5C6ESQ8_9BACT|nr:tandem-95 repeat protein [Rubripirellula tenax]TWU50499.1 putative bifunctional phosphatase/peptidyl-prolyl cis-trans isomerase [Rubripirellula tenax]
MRSSNAKSSLPDPSRGVRRLLERFILGGTDRVQPRKGRLLLESLEKRELMAGDMDLLFTDGVETAVDTRASVSDQSTSGLRTTTQAEGESAPDLVQFAKDLADAGVVFYGAHWCPACTAQKELFSDGKDNLPFVEVTNPDRSLNSVGIAEGISEYPTWDFPNGTRLVGVQTLATLSATANVAIPQSDQPTFEPIGNLTVRTGSPLHVPIDAYDPGDGPLTVTVSVANPALLQASVLTGNRSIRVDLNGYGDMVFELFEDRAPVASGRVIELADSGFYDGIIFHRVVDNFVIQAGDPTGTGTSGSTLGDFDDDFHPDLQHNREGVLSFAKSSDDTNNSQFFVTETPTRFLDFNHSIFGQLVEGFDVREAISETAVNNTTQNKPVNDVTINTIDVFDDTENGIVMLKAIGNATGTTNVTFTVTDADGNAFSETVSVTVTGDTDNSQPFLNTIAPTVSGTQDNAATLQLSSVDVEGDPVFYSASIVSGATNGTVNVDASTGLVTVTPTTGFTGPIVLNVGVSDTATASGQTADDNQRVTFNFEAENAVATPTGVDLQAASDSGSSSTDNITNAGSLTFSVSGVTSGATVELVNTASGSVVGTAVATGTTVNITTNNIAALGDGTYTLAARQRVGSVTSTASPTLSLVYDTTSPASVTSSALTTANVGRAYVSDLISTEEGNGLVYTLTTAPATATINATTGVINWTPTTAQSGANTFSLSLTDAAGNVRTESFTVTVSGTPQAEIKLRATDLNGNAITSIAVGQEFFLEMIGVDARAFTKPGVYAAYADILFDGTLVTPVTGTPIDYDDDFTVVPKGTFSDGLIDELGAVNNRIVASNEAESLIATVRMRALASGNVNIRSEPADDSDSDVLLFGQDERVPAGTVAYGSVSLAVGQSFTVGNDTATIAEDAAVTTIDVLANDAVVSGGGTLSVVSVTQPTSGGTATLSGGQVRFTPTADFNGTSVFTYRVANSTGVQQDGSVTVTVTPVNDAPNAVNDTFTVDQDSTNTSLAVLANDTFAPDTGETLTVTAVGTTTNGGTVTIATGGTAVLYTPAAGYVGPDSFTYTISDGTLTDQATVAVTVKSADAPPTAVADAFTVIEDAAEAVFDVTANDTRDASNQAFLLTAANAASGGAARVSTDGTQFFYKPAANFAGTETVTYTIRDSGGGSATGTVTFTVTPVNDAPTILNKTIPINRGTAADFPIFALSELPTNPDSGETLTITAATNTTTGGGTVRIDAATGRILYTLPSATYAGTDSITYTVSDGTLTSNGTLTVEVNDFALRNIFLDYNANSAFVPASLALKGTDALGNDVNAALTVSGDSYSFQNVLPGNYQIDIPALGFLQGASEARTIDVVSAAEDGDSTVQIDVGQLKAQYISIRDWMGTSPRKSLLVAVAPGQSHTLVIPSQNTDTITSPVVTLDEAGTNVTIRGTAPTGTGTAATTEEVQATVSTVNNRNVEFRGEVDGLRLYRINVQSSGVAFTPTTPTTTTTTTTTGSTGSVSTISSTQPLASESSSGLSSSSLTFGEQQAEGESVATAGVTVADVFVPSLLDAPNTSPLATTLDDNADESADANRADIAQNANVTDVSSIDSAMQSVAPELTRISVAGEQIADEESISSEAIDQVLSTDI